MTEQNTAFVDAIIRSVKEAASGRTRHEGQTPRQDETLVAEIEHLRAKNAELRAALEAVQAEIVLTGQIGEIVDEALA